MGTGKMGISQHAKDEPGGRETLSLEVRKGIPYGCPEGIHDRGMIIERDLLWKRIFQILYYRVNSAVLRSKVR
jgi:hypothetical protein